RGSSVRTSNFYLTAIKSFLNWMVKDRRLANSPLAHLSRGNVKLDRRHDRRPLPLEELRAIFQTAWRSAGEFRGLKGIDRAILYSVASASGFRASELANLCPNDFDLDDEPPTVTLSARETKNDQTAVQPLPPDIVAALRDYLAGRPADQPLWPGTWAERAAEMLRLDLDAAGIAYTVEGPDGPLYADFHALRHSYIALLDKSGATLKEAMQLARHSDPKLTMAVYGRAQLNDLGEAVRRLPSLLGESGPESLTLRATGTDPVCTGFAQTAATGRDCLRLDESEKAPEGANAADRKPLIAQDFEASCDPLRLLEGRVGDRTRTGDILIHSRPHCLSDIEPKPLHPNILRKSCIICKLVRALAESCMETRNFRRFRSVARKFCGRIAEGEPAENYWKCLTGRANRTHLASLTCNSTTAGNSPHSAT